MTFALLFLMSFLILISLAQPTSFLFVQICIAVSDTYACLVFPSSYYQDTVSVYLVLYVDDITWI